MIGQGLAGARPNFSSQIPPGGGQESVSPEIQQALAQVEQELQMEKRGAAVEDYKKAGQEYITGTQGLAGQRQKAVDASMVPREKGDLEKHGVKAAQILALLTGILTKNSQVRKGAAGVFRGAGNISSGKDRSYKADQENMFTKTNTLLDQQGADLTNTYNVNTGIANAGIDQATAAGQFAGEKYDRGIANETRNTNQSNFERAENRRDLTESRLSNTAKKSGGNLPFKVVDPNAVSRFSPSKLDWPEAYVPPEVEAWGEANFDNWDDAPPWLKWDKYREAH